MVVLVVLGSLSIKRLDRVFEQVRAQVEFSEPLVTATRKMEIDVLSYLANVRAFQGGYAEGRTLASQDARDVAQDVRDYERLVRTPDQRKLLERFSEQWQKLYESEEAAMTGGATNPEGSAHLAALCVALEQLLENEIQPDAFKSHNARTMATLASFEQANRVALLQFFWAVAIALAASAVVVWIVLGSQAALRQSQERLRLALDSSRQAEGRLAASLLDLRKAQQELVRRERMATLGQVAGTVAHHIRTPLGVIQNSVYYLEHVLPPKDPKMSEVLGETRRAVRNSNHIITEMLDFVRELIARPKVFPTGQAIASALEQVAIPETIQVQVTPGESKELQVFADPEQVTRILVNLIQNAVQAMPQGGELKIRVGPGNEGKISVAVTDSGCGIPEEHLEKIFDPLFSTKLRGIGLGLPIAQRYARANGGELTVESKPGRGTTVRLVLPGTVAIPFTREDSASSPEERPVAR